MVMDFCFEGTLVRVETPGHECDYETALDALGLACQQVLGWQEKQGGGK